MSDLQRAAIVGIYNTAQGNLTNRTSLSLAIESVLGALDDAGLTIKDVDGVVGQWVDGGMGPASFAEQFGATIRWHGQVSVGAASDSACIAHAVQAISHGLCSTVVIATGASRGPASRQAAVEQMATGRARGFEELWGGIRISYFALYAQRHMYEYGTTNEQMAEVAVACRRHASLNPNAMMRNPITVEDVMNSRWIAKPLHLLDCCLVNDGGGAIVITSIEKARDCKKTPIVLLGAGYGYSHDNIAYAPSLSGFASKISGPTAFQMAGVTHKDIDVVEVVDYSTFSVITELEDLGFCQKGEGGAFVGGGRIQLGGQLPVNTHGGTLSHSHGGACGVYFINEAVQQLRGEAGERQVANCNVALVQGSGGVLQAEFTGIFGRA